jgi:hypothetical protein
VDFRPQSSFLSAKARIEVVSQVEALDGVKFNFSSDLDILKLYDAEGRELFYTQDRIRKILYVYFVDTVPEGQTGSIEIYYRGRIEPPVPTTDVLPAQQRYFVGVVQPTPKYDTILFSQSAKWYPAPPEEDYFVGRLKIILPPEYQCLANGRLVEKGKLNGRPDVAEIEKMGNSYFIFETATPVKYLAFLVGKLILVRETADSLPLQTYISQDARGQKKDLHEEAEDILSFYASRFGPFPFEKLSIIQRLWPTSGGHSPASFIVLNELPWTQEQSLYVNVDCPVDLSRWKEYFLAHEIAHQWWGQGVTWATYHDLWISEGLAQFAAISYLKHKYGDQAFLPILKRFSQWTQKKAKWGPIILGSRLSFFDFAAFQAIVYNKASLVLNMLSELLGQEIFFRGLNEFFQTYRFGPTTTSQFFRAMEKVSGRDLAAFFRPWFESATLPAIKASYAVRAESGRHILTLKIAQLGETFVFPLAVEWNEGRTKVLRKVIVDEKVKEFEFELAVKPRGIRFNSDNGVPARFS